MQELKTLLDELKSQSFFNENEICVIGCSTSEVIGQKIGSVGSMEVAEAIFNALEEVKQDTGVSFAFQVVNTLIEQSQLNVKISTSNYGRSHCCSRCSRRR